MWNSIIYIDEVDTDRVYFNYKNERWSMRICNFINSKEFSPIQEGQSIPIECSECNCGLIDIDRFCQSCNGRVKQDKTVKDIQLRQVNYLIDKISTEKLISFMAEFKVSNIDYLLIGRLL